MDFFDLRTIAMLQGSLVLLLTLVFMVDSFRGPTRTRRSTRVRLNPTLYFAVRGRTPAPDRTEDRRRNGTLPFNPADLRIFS